MLRRLRYWLRRMWCPDHYLTWATDEQGRKFGRCLECLGETEGWR